MARQQPSRNGAATQKPADDAAKRDQYKRHLDRLLDEALQETFPASDPIAVTPWRRKPPAAPRPDARNA